MKEATKKAHECVLTLVNAMKSILEKSFLFFVIAALSILIHCSPDDEIPSFNIDQIQGMRPIYASDLQAEIKEPKEVIEETGRFILYQDMILVTDKNKGIHVFDNASPSSPKDLYFIELKENNDMAIRDGILYIDNGPDLIGYEITKTGIIEKYRISNVFYKSNNNQEYPPQDNVYYVCPDRSKGEIVGWKLDMIDQPDCYKRDEVL